MCLNSISCLGLADEEKRGVPTQPTNTIASKIKRTAEQQKAQAVTPALLPVIISTSTVEEIEELPEEEENRQTNTPVTTSIIGASQTLHRDDEHFINLNPKVEDSVIDISVEEFQHGGNSHWQNEVKSLTSIIRNQTDDFFLVRKRRWRRTGATSKF